MKALRVPFGEYPTGQRSTDRSRGDRWLMDRSPTALTKELTTAVASTRYCQASMTPPGTTNRKSPTTSTISGTSKKSGRVTIYLPSDLHNALNLSYRELSYESARTTSYDLQKLQDFYPLLVAVGLNNLNQSDTDDLLSMLEYLQESTADRPSCRFGLSVTVARCRFRLSPSVES
ncbi:hypothetical protein D8S78_21180 [Natrialba swarupiae]|nr:hypothetical protein [Natrialba swarupiae]